MNETLKNPGFADALFCSDEDYEPYGAVSLELQLMPRDVQSAWESKPPPQLTAELLDRYLIR